MSPACPCLGGSTPKALSSAGHATFGSWRRLQTGSSDAAADCPAEVSVQGDRRSNLHSACSRVASTGSGKHSATRHRPGVLWRSDGACGWGSRTWLERAVGVATGDPDAHRANRPPSREDRVRHAARIGLKRRTDRRGDLRGRGTLGTWCRVDARREPRPARVPPAPQRRDHQP